MAVDYTKLFTIVGKYADKVRDYYAYVGTFTTDKTAIETVLGAQSVVYLGDGLTESYDSYKTSVSDWISDLIGHVETVLTDEALVGVNFSFGSSPTLDAVFEALLKDMTENDKNVTASVSTVGSVVYDTANTDVGVVKVGTKLDGITPPLDGAQAIREYAGLTTQLTPTAETVTLTCVSDSETGGSRGSETFQITGTGAQSDPYSPTEENIGSPGSVSVADSSAESYVSNSSFDDWEDDEPTGWTVEAGTPVTDFKEEDTEILYSPGSSLRTLTTNAVTISQVLSSSTFERGKSFFISIWAKKIDSDNSVITLAIKHSPGGTPTDIFTENHTLDQTDWTNYCSQFVMPWEVEGDLELHVTFNSAGAGDCVFDQLVITPCEYLAGVSIAVFGGPEKWLVGDTITIPLSNNNAGLFQNFFRRAFRIQLPTDATPTISDGLVT